MLENKQMVHIASEIIVLVGMTYHFNKQNRSLRNHIEDLAQRVEEQEDLIQKHETIIKKLVDAVNTLHSHHQPPTPVVQAPVVQAPVVQAPVVQTPVVQTPEPKSIVEFMSPNDSHIIKMTVPSSLSNIDESSIEDLDAEILEELEELEN